MLIITVNKSRKRRFLTSKRIISSILFPVEPRVHLGDIPSRSIIDLISKLKSISGNGMNIKIFIESKEGYHGFKMISIGKAEGKYDIFESSNSSIDEKLAEAGIVPSFAKKAKVVTIQQLKKHGEN